MLVKKGGSITEMSILFFFASFLLFLAMIKNVLAIQRGGVYPSKKVLRKRAEGMIVGGIVFLLIGILLTIIIH